MGIKPAPRAMSAGYWRRRRVLEHLERERERAEVRAELLECGRELVRVFTVFGLRMADMLEWARSAPTESGGPA